MLAVISTHPVQYHAPVYRIVQQRFGIPVTAVYGSDFSVSGYRDEEFGVSFSWDTDLLSGYSQRFLSRAASGGARSADAVSTQGLGRALQEISPDAVLLTGYSPRFHQQAFFETCRLKCPILFRSETTDHTQRGNPAGRWARDFLLTKLYSSCAALLYIGKRSRDHYVRLGVPEQKLRFSPYGVDTAPFRADENGRSALRNDFRAELGVSDGERVHLFSGKLSERKGPRLILEALRRLPPDRRQRSVAAFLGDGAMKNELALFADESPRIKTVFIGFQNQGRLSGYYHAADLLVLPSLHSETWGLVVNEALCHGLPAVVSDAVGCAPDLIDPGVTGEIARAGDAASLGSAFEKAELLVGAAGTRERCRAKAAGYSLEKAAEGIAEAYRFAVAGKGRG